MDEIWRNMVSKGDGVLRWPRRGSASFDISRALVDRADRYVGSMTIERQLRESCSASA
jgi:hypothetical protein